MGSVEVDAEQERPPVHGEAVDQADGVLADQVGEIARLGRAAVVVPEVGRLLGVLEVVEAAAVEAPEVIIAALQRPELRRRAQVPLADQPRLVAGLLEQRGQGGMFGRQAHGAQAQGLFQPHRQTVLVAAGDQPRAGGRADRGIGIGLHEPEPLLGQAIDVGGLVVGPAVAADVGVPQVVGQQEDDVRRPGGSRRPRPHRREGEGAGPEELAARDAGLGCHDDDASALAALDGDLAARPMNANLNSYFKTAYGRAPFGRAATSSGVRRLRPFTMHASGMSPSETFRSTSSGWQIQSPPRSSVISRALGCCRVGQA